MKIVLLDAYAAHPGDLSWDGLREFGEVTVYDRTAPKDVLARIGDAEVVYVNKVRLDEQTLRQCENLKLVSVLATGYNVVDTAAAKELGILVCNSPSYSTASVAQLTIAHLLELCSHVGALSDACHSGRWAACPDFCFWDAPLMELSGKTMGIIGYGTIGRAVGAIAQALGMRLLVNARHSDPALESPTCRYAPLEELLAQSDVVTLHCPQTPETTGLIDRARIAQMKDGALLLNTSRGGLIVEQDLADALCSGKLRGAAVDVVSQEPIRPENPLLSAPNCLMTPHVAWAPLEARQRLLAIAKENLAAYCSGSPINVVNP